MVANCPCRYVCGNLRSVQRHLRRLRQDRSRRARARIFRRGRTGTPPPHVSRVPTRRRGRTPPGLVTCAFAPLREERHVDPFPWEVHALSFAVVDHDLVVGHGIRQDIGDVNAVEPREPHQARNRDVTLSLFDQGEEGLGDVRALGDPAQGIAAMRRRSRSRAPIVEFTSVAIRTSRSSADDGA